jgi:hypothetical protein
MNKSHVVILFVPHMFIGARTLVFTLINLTGKGANIYCADCGNLVCFDSDSGKLRFAYSPDR